MIKQIVPEAPGSNLFLKVALGGCDNTQVDFDILTATVAGKGMRL